MEGCGTKWEVGPKLQNACNAEKNVLEEQKNVPEEIRFLQQNSGIQ